MTINSNFDQFLQQKFLANAEKKRQSEFSRKGRYTLKTAKDPRAGDYGSNSRSPNYRDLQFSFDRDGRASPLENQPVPQGANYQQVSVPRRQIDTH